MSAAEPQSALATALRERLSVIADREFAARDSAGHLARLKEVSEQIVALELALPRPLDPQLAHFLQRRSYDKALAWLEQNAASPPGK